MCKKGANFSPIVLGVSGKKKSGKSTLTRFLVDNSQTIWPGLKVCVLPFAGELKRICVDLLGLNPAHVYGSDEDKDTLTEYRWEDLPHVVADADFWFNHEESLRSCGKSYHTPGPMTVRQILQEVGTGIFRRMRDSVHTDAWGRRVEEGEADIYIADDLRFLNEAEAVHQRGGRLLRVLGGVSSDGHESETALTDDSFCFDARVEGRGLATLGDSYWSLLYQLKQMGVVGGSGVRELMTNLGEGAL